MDNPLASGPLDFTGRGVLVTGGGRGVGRGIAIAFLDAGADVVICGRKEPESLPSSADGRAASFVTADVRDADQAAALVAEATDRLGRLDVLVNNAGGSPAADASTASPRFHESIVRLNLLAPLHVAQRANAVMQEQADGGSIVNIGSMSGMRPSPGTAAYGAAKAGLVNLTESLAIEWAPKVRVNCVTAGMIRTETVDYADAAATVPLGRVGEPADVAGACLFLSSSLAAYISGSNLVVHGGGESPGPAEAYRS